MTMVKICGLREPEHAVAAARAGADMLGLMLAPSRRQVSPEQAASIAAAVRGAELIGPRPLLVGVFVNASPADMRELAQTCGLDALQLSGDEPAEILGSLGGLAVIKAVRLAGAPAEAAWMNTDTRLLVDAHVAGSYGGAGVVADWDAAEKLARRRPLLLAGGLTPSTVAAAMRHVLPWGVDVSSGVETDGVKDMDKIQLFVQAVRAVDKENATR